MIILLCNDVNLDMYKYITFIHIVKVKMIIKYYVHVEGRIIFHLRRRWGSMKRNWEQVKFICWLILHVDTTDKYTRDIVALYHVHKFTVYPSRGF